MKICCMGHCTNERQANSSFCPDHTMAVRDDPSLLQYFVMKKPTKTKKKDKPKTEDPIKSLQKGLVELASDVGILKDKVEALEKMHEDLPPQQPTP